MCIHGVWSESFPFTYTICESWLILRDKSEYWLINADLLILRDKSEYWLINADLQADLSLCSMHWVYGLFSCNAMLCNTESALLRLLQ